jgi:cell wall-associated NlpC family hydrolase
VRATARITTLSTLALTLASLAGAGAGVPSALAATASATAASTGGTTATPASTSSRSGSGSAKAGSATSASKPNPLDAPITAKTPKLEYDGPIYQLKEGKVIPYVAPAPANTVLGSTGGEPVAEASEGRPKLLVPGATAELVDGGLAAAPMSAPQAIERMIWAANKIIGRPYVFGGGHGSFKSFGYDCSGTVSFALHGDGLIKLPMDSSEMMRWSGKGVGRWVTVFANPGHAYMTIAGLRLDTSTADDPSNQNGPRWRPLRPANAGFVLRHPAGL